MSEEDTTTFYPQKGEILDGKYEIQDTLGTGAMGSVIRARHVLRKVPVALKFMSPEILGQRDVIDRFLNEGVAASKIDSEHVVTVYDVSKLPSGVPYMVMEYLEGEDLSHVLRRQKPYIEDVPRAVHFTLQMLRGLQAAHKVKIVHRDMKPANCFVIGKDGDPDFIKIVDFGISKVRAEDNEGIDLTHAGAALGTPLYMSLEQARSPKDVDARTDLYSVAVILYELLAGVPPFVPKSGTLSELFTMLAIEEPRSLDEIRDDLPMGLWEALRIGLEKDREKRHQTAGQMAEALAPFADERSDHIVSKMLRRTATGARSRPPPPNMVIPGPAGTVMMDTVPQTPRQALPPTIDDVPATAAAANTAQGTVQDAGGKTLLEDRRATPLVWAVAVVAVAAVAAAAWALGRAGNGDETKVAAPDHTSTPAPPPQPLQPQPPVPVSDPPPSTAPLASTSVVPPLPVPKVPVPLPGKKLKDLGIDK